MPEFQLHKKVIIEIFARRLKDFLNFFSKNLFLKVLLVKENDDVERRNIMKVLGAAEGTNS